MAEETSEFNMAVSYLNRLNIWFYQAGNAALNRDADQWYHSLLLIYRELRTSMKKQAIVDSKVFIESLNTKVIEWVNKKNRTHVSKLDTTLYSELQDFEILLRQVMKEGGLLLKFEKSPEFARI